jgi:AhpD family alkylhydroperoxidase
MSEHGAKRMSERDYKAEAPEAYKALLDLGRAVDAAGLDKTLIELVKIRVSQINGCAYCLQLHLNMARRIGVEEAKLGLVAVWHEAGIFNAREQAALAWAEALTRMLSAEVSEEVYKAAIHEFPAGEIAHLTAAIANINAWNRIAGALRWTPPIPKAPT